MKPVLNYWHTARRQVQSHWSGKVTVVVITLPVWVCLIWWLRTMIRLRFQ